ncbi:MAG: hypothetical protein IH968_16250 [Gemmatimonadetes bacterium]|nr:hypothetical protein [Gemmatimonadota bacterium]
MKVLLSLQVIDLQIEKCVAREAEIPKQKNKFEIYRKRMQAELKERNEAFQRFLLEQKECEGEIEQKQTQIARYEQQLNVIKKNEEYQALLHEIDLAVNKTLALAGRDEPRDFIDILFVHERVLPLAGLTWSAVGKDPGFTPLSLIELLKRRGRHRPAEMERLNLAVPYDPITSKEQWLRALEDAEEFARSRPTDELGCLYYSPDLGRFTVPLPEVGLAAQGLVVHFGAPGGVLPRVPDDGFTGAPNRPEG